MIVRQTKVKIFSGHNTDELENQLNEWLNEDRNEDDEFETITLSGDSSQHGETINTVIVVLYKTNVEIITEEEKEARESDKAIMRELNRAALDVTTAGKLKSGELEEMEEDYQDNRVRYYSDGKGSLIFNTHDLSMILENKPEFFTGKYVDLADAQTAALQQDQQLYEWLVKTFGGAKLETLVRPSE